MSEFIVNRRGEFLILVFPVRLERSIDGVFFWNLGGILDGLNEAKIRRSSGRSWAGVPVRIILSDYQPRSDTFSHSPPLSGLTGRHPCLGMRFAKLEVKIIIAMFLTRYAYSLVDGQGKKLEKLPEPYRDNL